MCRGHCRCWAVPLAAADLRRLTAPRRRRAVVPRRRTPPRHAPTRPSAGRPKQDSGWAPELDTKRNPARPAPRADPPDVRVNRVNVRCLPVRGASFRGCPGWQRDAGQGPAGLEAVSPGGRAAGAGRGGAARHAGTAAPSSARAPR